MPGSTRSFSLWNAHKRTPVESLTNFFDRSSRVRRCSYRSGPLSSDSYQRSVCYCGLYTNATIEEINLRNPRVVVFAILILITGAVRFTADAAERVDLIIRG